MGWLPRRAGLPGLNGGGAAAAVPQGIIDSRKLDNKQNADKLYY